MPRPISKKSARRQPAPTREQHAADRAAAAEQAAARDAAAYWPKVEDWLLRASPGFRLELRDASAAGVSRLSNLCRAAGLPVRVEGCTLVALAPTAASEGRDE